MKPVLFSTPMVQAILDGRKTRKKLYPRNGEDPLSKTHLMKRLLNGIEIDETLGCWIWQMAHNGIGYGTLTVGGKRKYAHRLSYEIFRGDVAIGEFVLHDCDNPSCINPDHLHTGTQRDNMRECYIRGRSSIKPVNLCGEKNGQAKLTRNDVFKIQALAISGVTQRIIAQEFGISQSQVSNIKRGLRWNEADIVFNRDDQSDFG